MRPQVSDPVIFHVERDVLADAVAWAARTLPARAPLNPILQNLRLEATGTGSLQISSFDQEVSSRVEVPADVEQEGVILVSGRLLSDIAKMLPGRDVTVQVEGSRAKVKAGRSTFGLPTVEDRDYPQPPETPAASGSLRGADFAEALAQVCVAASRDDNMPMLTGVRMEIEGSQITLAATDRYRLAVRTVHWSPEDPSISAAALVPARTLNEAGKALSGADQVTIGLSTAQGEQGVIGINGLGRRTTMRLLSGEFPKFRQLLPDQTATQAWVEKSALVEATKRMALVASHVKLSFTSGELGLSAGAAEDSAASAVDYLECETEGEDLDIAFNPTFLLEGLQAISEPFVRLAFTHPNKPAVMAGCKESRGDHDDSYTYLLMPVRVSGN